MGESKRHYIELGGIKFSSFEGSQGVPVRPSCRGTFEGG
jgi:hypothetical protein